MLMYHGFYHGFFPGWFGFWGFGWPLMAAIAVIPFWRICTRVGHSPWLSLLILIPMVNLIFLYILAFGEWPALRGTGQPPASGANSSTPGR